jgi:hypothetical protein
VVSEMDDYFINQEIEEYVFTPGITKNVYRFLNAIINNKERYNEKKRNFIFL